MKEKDLKETIGKKLEEAYLAKPMGQAPSEETVAKWIAIADQRRAERRRRKKKIISCAAACALCVCIGVTCVVKPPNAVAGGSGGTKVETGMSSVKHYLTTDSIPNNVKDSFMLFSSMVQGFNFSEAIFETNDSFEKLSILYEDVDGKEIFIEEIKGTDGTVLTHEIDSGAIVENWGSIEVYINLYNRGDKETAYDFMYNDILITINVPREIETEEIKKIVERDAQL